MSEPEKNPWALYLLMPEDIPEDESHYLITPDYCLLYTDRALDPQIAVKDITGETQALPPLAREWLKGEITAIRREYEAEHRQEILERTKSFTALFRDELEQERKNLKEAAAGG